MSTETEQSRKAGQGVGSSGEVSDAKRLGLPWIEELLWSIVHEEDEALRERAGKDLLQIIRKRWLVSERVEALSAPTPPATASGGAAIAVEEVERFQDAIDAASFGSRWLDEIVERQSRHPLDEITIERSDVELKVFWSKRRPIAAALVFRDQMNFAWGARLSFRRIAAPQANDGVRDWALRPDVIETIKREFTTLERYCTAAWEGRYPSDGREFRRRVDCARDKINEAIERALKATATTDKPDQQMTAEHRWQDPDGVLRVETDKLRREGDGSEPFPQPRQKPGEEPCGECHIQPGETCDICGASRPPSPAPQQDGETGAGQ